MYKLRTNVVARGALSVNEFGMLRKLSPRAAEVWLNAFKAEVITDEERADILAAVGDAYLHHNHEVMQNYRFPQRPLFVAAAWLAGASWGQLAQMFGVTRQTIARTAERLLPQPRILVGNKVSHEQLSAMRQVFVMYDEKAPELLAKLPPADLAQLLLLETFERPEGDPYGEDIGNPITTAESSH